MGKFIQGPRKDDLMYLEGNEIKGFVTLSGDSVYNVWVRPEYRRQGVGTRLMRTLETVAQKLNLPSLKLSVSLTNSPALSMYRKLGYTLATSSISMKKEVDGVQAKEEGESKYIPPFLP